MFFFKRKSEIQEEEEDELKSIKIIPENHVDELNFEILKASLCTNQCTEGTLDEAYGKEAKYIKHIDGCRYGLIDHMYDIPIKWNTGRCENLIIFVGGSNHVYLEPEVMTVLKYGLANFAEESHSWVIASGLDADVSKVVSELIPEENETYYEKNLNESGLTLIGMTPTRFVDNVKISSSESYKVKEKYDLSKGFSKYIFLSNYPGEDKIETCVEQYQQNIQEIFIKKDGAFYLPQVLIVIEGGLETLVTINEAIQNEKHVLIIANTKKCADLIIEASFIVKEIPWEKWLMHFGQLLNRRELSDFAKSKEIAKKTKRLLMNIFNNENHKYLIHRFYPTVQAHEDFTFELKDILRRCKDGRISSTKLFYSKNCLDQNRPNGNECPIYSNHSKNYLRVDEARDANGSTYKKIYQYLILSLKMPKPKALISVFHEYDSTATASTIDEDTAERIKKVAKESGAWLISSGRVDDVLIPDARIEYDQPVTLGIAPWQSDNKPFNKHFNYFLFFDEIETEFTCRSIFEDCVKEFRDVSRILILVGGASEMAGSLLHAIKNFDFVVPISGSGGVADVVIEAKRACSDLLYWLRVCKCDHDYETNVRQIQTKLNNEILKTLEAYEVKDEQETICHLIRSAFEIDRSSTFLDPQSSTIDVTLNQVLEKDSIKKRDHIAKSGKLTKLLNFLEGHNRTDGSYLKKLYKSLIYEAKMKTPDVIISVIGAVRDQTFKESFKRDLIQVTRNTNALIVQSDSDAGISEFIFQAVEEDRCRLVDDFKFNILGISSIDDQSSDICNKYALSKHGRYSYVYLEGVTETDQVLTFRCKMEEFIKDHLGIPRILIVFGYDNNTLQSIRDALNNYTFVILFSDDCTHGRFISSARHETVRSPENQRGSKLVTLVDNYLDNSGLHSENASNTNQLLVEISDHINFSYLVEIVDLSFNINYYNNSLEQAISNILSKDIKRFPIDFLNTEFYSKTKRVPNRTDKSSLEKIHMQLTHGLGIPKPELLLSIVCPKENVRIDQDLLNAVKQAIISVAKKTNAWIICSGVAGGISEIIGDAVGEDIQSNDVTLIGVAPWRYVTLAVEDGNGLNDVLHRSYNSFILVDDDSLTTIGKEADFRSTLELYIQKEENIPKCLIVFGGGKEALQVIEHDLSDKSTKTFATLVTGSGGIADFMSFAITKDATDQEYDSFIDTHLCNDTFHDIRNSKRALLNVVQNYKEYISIIIEPDVKKIEGSILETVVKAQYHQDTRLHLAMIWNLYEVAKEELVAYLRVNLDSEKENTASDLFRTALVENKPKFVELFLKSGFSTKWYYRREEKIIELFNAKKKSGKKIRDLLSLCVPVDEHFSYDDLNNFLQQNCDMLQPFFFPENNKFSFQTHGDLFLFMWCLLSNRIEIAKVFWRQGHNQLCFALIAVKLLNYFATITPDESEALEAFANEFEDLAIGILEVYDEYTTEYVRDVLVIRYLDFIQMDCLQLAVHCKCERFLSHILVQKTLGGIWKGEVTSSTPLTQIEANLKECQIEQYNDDPDYIFNNKKMNRIFKKHNALSLESIKRHLHIPKWKYCLNVAFYIIFLAVFSLVMLTDRHASSEESSSSGSNDTNSTDSIGNQTPKATFPVWETILLIWIVSLIVEEIRQAFFSKISKGGKLTRLKNHFESGWNQFDLLGCVVFVFGFAIEIGAYVLGLPSSHSSHIVARTILSLDLTIWYVRSLQFCQLLKSLGPKILMIKHMLNDLKYFLIIIATFMLGFGVAIQSIADPYPVLNYKIIFDILEKAYWPIHGEMKVLDSLSEKKCNNESSAADDTSSCLGAPRYALTHGLLILYMIISSVLLLNLLVAMFTTTFEVIQSKSGVIWMNQRYELISQYMESPVFPPPLNLFAFIWMVLMKAIDKLRNKQTIGKDEKQKMQSDVIIDFEKKCTIELMRRKNEAQVPYMDSQMSEMLEKQFARKNTRNSKCSSAFSLASSDNKIAENTRNKSKSKSSIISSNNVVAVKDERSDDEEQWD